jgi:hypothetical protein
MAGEPSGRLDRSDLGDDTASEDRMRARDVRAIAFCAVTTLVVAGASKLLLHDLLAAGALTLAYAAFILTRPRMVRVFRRLSGEPDWSGYFDNTGTRLKPPPGPGTAPSSPRPVERP